MSFAPASICNNCGKKVSSHRFTCLYCGASTKHLHVPDTAADTSEPMIPRKSAGQTFGFKDQKKASRKNGDVGGIWIVLVLVYFAVQFISDQDAWGVVRSFFLEGDIQQVSDVVVEKPSPEVQPLNNFEMSPDNEVVIADVDVVVTPLPGDSLEESGAAPTFEESDLEWVLYSAPDGLFSIAFLQEPYYAQRLYREAGSFGSSDIVLPGHTREAYYVSDHTLPFVQSVDVYNFVDSIGLESIEDVFVHFGDSLFPPKSWSALIGHNQIEVEGREAMVYYRDMDDSDKRMLGMLVFVDELTLIDVAISYAPEVNDLENMMSYLNYIVDSIELP